jgi:hypothetical protein
MTEQQICWIIPEDPSDLAPLPALRHDETHFSTYNRRKQVFGEVFEHLFMPTYDTFDQCRAAMVDLLTGTLEESNKHCRWLAQSIEHIKTIPTATFPNVSREVREQGQQEEAKAQAQEETKAKEVKPAPELKKGPTR